jgi:hypothetical protein
VTAGLSGANLANKWLNTLSNTSFAAGTTTYAALHTGDPGDDGTSNASAETDRKAITWSAASNGSKAITTTLPSWTSWDAGSETITHVSVWDASTEGNFLYSFALTASKSITNGDSITLSSHTVSLTPLAAD